MRDSQSPNDDSVVVIDVGKSFLAAAQEFFPLYGLRKIEAVVLTHAHADGEYSFMIGLKVTHTLAHCY